MIYWIWLTLINGLGPITQKRLLQHFGTPETIFKASLGDLAQVPRLQKNVLEQIKDDSYLEKAKQIEDQVLAQDIKLLTYDDPEYPTLVKSIRDFPVLLYYRSKTKLHHGGVGVVGSRRCTNYGKQVAVEVAEFLGEHKIPVVSGMAKGIDGYAHTASINSKGYTVAFVAHGVDICYPTEQNSLMDMIIEHGAVISEYAPGVRPRKEYFPRRNYLISSWVEKLLVVEAAERSGAMITAEMAKKQGKEVLAVPNNIYQEESKGTNRLIRDGAKIYLSSVQLLSLPYHDQSMRDNLEDRIQTKHTIAESDLDLNTPIIARLNAIEKKIYERLKSPKQPEELLDLTEGDYSSLSDILFKMELDGVIRTLPGNLISR